MNAVRHYGSDKLTFGRVTHEAADANMMTTEIGSIYGRLTDVMS